MGVSALDRGSVKRDRWNLTRDQIWERMTQENSVASHSNWKVPSACFRIGVRKGCRGGWKRKHKFVLEA